MRACVSHIAHSVFCIGDMCSKTESMCIIVRLPLRQIRKGNLRTACSIRRYRKRNLPPGHGIQRNDALAVHPTRFQGSSPMW